MFFTEINAKNNKKSFPCGVRCIVVGPPDTKEESLAVSATEKTSRNTGVAGRALQMDKDFVFCWTTIKLTNQINH